jgi:hypothetical protein
MLSENLNKINVAISENNDNITCTVEITPLGRFCRKKIYVDTKDVVNYLLQQGLQFIETSEPHKRLKNYKEGVSNKGTWVFLKKKPPIKKTTRKRTKKQ